MAGGIDWFRWHHGSVNDPKFQLVAKRSQASVAEVIAVWASLLEAASQADKRGAAGEPDFEAMDCSLGLDDGKAARIYTAMQARDLIDQIGVITSWEKRQPKREREDDNSTARVQAFRERQRHETPSNANETLETPRGEESREDISTSLRSVESAPKRAARKCPKDFVLTSEMLTWALENHPNVDVTAETEKFRDHTFKNAISDWPGALRNWIRKADEMRPKARASPQSFRQQDQDAAAAQMAAFGALVAAKPSRPMEVIDVTPRGMDRQDLLEDGTDLRRSMAPHVGRA